MENIVWFTTTPNLAEYGFDIQTNRVVDRHERPDGVYLKRSQTYRLNRKLYTHDYLRLKAIEQTTDIESIKPTAKSTKIVWRMVIALVLIIAMVSVTTCNVDVSITSSVDSTH